MIEILKETARYLVCVKPIGIAAQGTQAEAMPQLLSEQLGCDIFPVLRQRGPGHWKICCSTTGRKTRPTWSGGSAAA